MHSVWIVEEMQCSVVSDGGAVQPRDNITVINIQTFVTVIILAVISGVATFERHWPPGMSTSSAGT